MRMTCDDLDKNIVYQLNKSTERLESSGDWWGSCKVLRHLPLLFGFYITEHWMSEQPVYMTITGWLQALNLTLITTIHSENCCTHLPWPCVLRLAVMRFLSSWVVLGWICLAVVRTSRAVGDGGVAALEGGVVAAWRGVLLSLLGCDGHGVRVPVTVVTPTSYTTK